jgi:hypothetical protein
METLQANYTVIKKTDNIVSQSMQKYFVILHAFLLRGLHFPQ